MNFWTPNGVVAILDCGYRGHCPPKKGVSIICFSQDPKTLSVYVVVTKPFRWCSNEWKEQRRKSGDVIIERLSLHREVREGGWVTKTLDFNSELCVILEGMDKPWIL